MSVCVESSLHKYRCDDEYNYFAMQFYGAKYRMTRNQYAKEMSENLDKDTNSIVPYINNKSILYFDIDEENVYIEPVIEEINTILLQIYENPSLKRYLVKNRTNNKYHLYYYEIISTLNERRYIHSKINGDIEILDDRLLRKGAGIRVDGYRCKIKRKDVEIQKEKYEGVDFDIGKTFFYNTYPFRDEDKTPLKMTINEVNPPPENKSNPYLITAEGTSKNLKYLNILLDKNEIKSAKLFSKETNDVFYDKKTQLWISWSPKKLLWIENSSNADVQHKIHDMMDPIYDDCYKYYLEVLNRMDETDEAYDGVKGMVKTLKKKALIVTGAILNRIANLCKGSYGCMDVEFERKLDVDKDHLPLKDGKIINVKTLEIRDRNFSDHWSFEFPYEFLGEDLSDNIFEKFFREIFDVEEVYNFMRDLCGYNISFDEKEQILVIFTNDKGRNGKGIITQNLNDIFEQFVSDMNVLLIMEGKINDDAELCKLYKIRCALFGEPPAGIKWKNDRIKKLTGRDKFKPRDAHQKGRDTQVLVKGATPVLSCNGGEYLPDPKDLEPAVLARLCMCFFDYYYRNESDPDWDPDDPKCKKIDITLGDRMYKRKDEVFTWFVMASHHYNTRPIDRPLMMDYPQIFAEKRDRYLDDRDLLQNFIDQCCYEGEDEFEHVITFYQSFRHYLVKSCGKNWHKANGSYSDVTISQIMEKKKGWSKGNKIHDSKQKKCWLGLRVYKENIHLYNEKKKVELLIVDEDD